MVDEFGGKNVIQVDIDDQMKDAFLDYAMSVIVSRALPDVRDGLKPVHRRILYALHDLGMTPNKSHKKSARIVGEVLGKYHPHGDTAVYDTMVRMAQDFSYRYPLIDGHGNFGSVDGDSAAAMRYTEARMSKITTELLRDLNKDTVDFIPNFDETLKEPDVLPSRFPNLLVNGSSGIAVGMSTSIPPHNLREVIDGIIRVIENPDVELAELMEVIKGPDFPTGGLIMGKGAIYKAYKTGRGKVTVRAKVRIEENDASADRIIIDELPYRVNKARLIGKIADMVRDEKIEGISDIRDESDRRGMRIVIKIKRGSNPKIVLNQLFKHSQMQITFSVIMLSIVDGEPKVLNLREMIDYYLEFQKEIITRRTKYDLDKAERRAHILEGYMVALDDIDNVIQLIREADDVDTARQQLINRYDLSEDQANAILRMRLQRLTALERDKIDAEYADLKEDIEYYKEVLGSEEKLLGIIKDEIKEIRDKYGDDRRTKILNQTTDLDLEDLIEEEQVVVTMTNQGYIKRMPVDTYRSQRRGGKGMIGTTTREEDFVENVFITSTHNYFLFFTNKGLVYRLKGYQIPQASRQSRGTAIVNLLQLEGDEKVSSIIPLSDFEESKYLTMVTQKGMIKKTPLVEYDSNYTGIIGIKLQENDELMEVKNTNKDENVILVTHNGKAIRFNEKDIRAVGRAAQGVKGIDLSADDYLVSMGMDSEGTDLLVISEKGYGKRTDIENYRIQQRYGKGIITLNITEKNGPIASTKVVNEEDEIIIITAEGIIIRTKIEEISKTGRNTMGVKVIDVEEDDYVVSVGKIKPEDLVEEEEDEDEKEDIVKDKDHKEVEEDNKKIDEVENNKNQVEDK
ncbi:MAG TPA: DNA gyrase subunit A [Halanaerobiales bacterium]|nr:DNA gyrase subunit A [Halanaerobiales bacterium]